MSKFKFDESLFREFRSSAKEGLSDIALNDEEIDKIQFELSQSSRKIQLRTDYSNFANHIFFGSAYAAVNFGLSRILNDYPIFGELKEKNEWKRVNSGFENYFFDQYPKQQGYAFFTSSAYVELSDHEYALRPGTGSVAFECVIKPYDNINTIAGRKAIFSLYDPDATTGVAAYFSSSADKALYFEVVANSNRYILSSSYSSSVSASHHVAFVYDAPSLKQIIYIDGQQVVSASAPSVGSMNPSSKKLYIGAMSSSLFGGFGSYFTGAIDDARLWISQDARTPELIKKNYYRTIHADVSGGLKLYYKFNETSDSSPSVADYSSFGLHGIFTGAYSYSANIKSGTLGSWFKDSGDPIYSQTNTRVSSSLSLWRNSGSYYDKENRNLIFNLVPSFFIDDQETNEDMQRFLLLTARNYDQLKLYIDNISNIKNTSTDEFENTPDDLLGVVAENYGMDIGGVYEGASALEYVFGENVLPSGSMDASISTIRSQIKRNLLSNLIYILKTKSTRQALEASLRAMGLEEDVVNINEYSIFSGGIQTGRTFRTVERRVAKFPVSGAVILTSSVFSGSRPFTYETRVLFNTGSAFLTSSIMQLSGAGSRFYLEVERQSLTSSNAVAKLYSVSSSITTAISSSVCSLYDNNWISFAATRNPSAGTFSLFVSKLDRDEIVLSESVSKSSVTFAAATPTSLANVLGSKTGPNYFDGHMQEFRAWSAELSQSIILNHVKDFESLEVENMPGNISSLLCYLKLNDYSGSFAGSSEAHDYVHGLSGSVYSETLAAFSSSGKYINKLEPSYSYDFAINNDKVRVRNSSVFTDEDVIEDLPYLSVDMSPVVSLNKEIVRWFGDLEKFNNIIGQPYNRYRNQDEIEFLNQYRHHFFAERTNNKISFKNYLNLLKWFDSNFTYFLSQLIPLDIESSLSSFVIEPHLFEYNKINYPFSNKKTTRPVEYLASASLLSSITSELNAKNLNLADPGRFGSPASASAAMSFMTLNYSASFEASGNVLGLNFKNSNIRKSVTTQLQNNSFNHSLSGTGNGFYTTTISSSNYMKNVLNAYDNFHISGVHYIDAGGDSINSNYLTSAFRPLNTHFTGAFNGVTDQRWQWLGNPRVFTAAAAVLNGHTGSFWDSGIGYGGGWGQFLSINGKSRQGKSATAGLGYPYLELGNFTYVNAAQSTGIEIEEGSDDAKTVVLWPSLRSYSPIKIYSIGAVTGSIISLDQGIPPQKASFLGEKIDIQGYKSLSINILGKRIFAEGADARQTRLVFEFRFQFFDGDNSSLDSFEGTFSGSYFGSGSVSDKVENKFIVTEAPPAGGTSHEFVSSFYRELPSAKYMKLHVTALFKEPTGATVYLGYKTSIKGTLFKEVSDSNEKLLKFEGK